MSDTPEVLLAKEITEGIIKTANAQILANSHVYQALFGVVEIKLSMPLGTLITRTQAGSFFVELVLAFKPEATEALLSNQGNLLAGFMETP